MSPEKKDNSATDTTGSSAAVKKRTRSNAAKDGNSMTAAKKTRARKAAAPAPAPEVDGQDQILSGRSVDEQPKKTRARRTTRAEQTAVAATPVAEPDVADQDTAAHAAAAAAAADAAATALSSDSGASSQDPIPAEMGQADMDELYRRRLYEEAFRSSGQSQKHTDQGVPLFDNMSGVGAADEHVPPFDGGYYGGAWGGGTEGYDLPADYTPEPFGDDYGNMPYDGYSSVEPQYSGIFNSAAERAALNELRSYHDQRSSQSFDADDEGGDSPETAREKTIVRRALSRDREPVEPLLTADSDAARRDEVRISMARFCYAPEELYGESSWFEPYELSELYQSTRSVFNIQFSRADAVGLVDLARSCPQIERMDVAFVEYLQSHFPLASKYDQQAFNVVLFALFDHMSEGHICINLNSITSIYECISRWTDLAREFEERHNPVDELNQFIYLARHYAPTSIEALKKLLSRALAVGSAEESNSPLVFDLDRLYIRRYFDYERQIAAYIRNVTSIDFDEARRERLRELIAILFPLQKDLPGVNWQKVAAAMAATSRFSVISGGPGTGKTTTVLRIILMLICIDEGNRDIKMCAPTGKAAARMGESIARQLKDSRTRKTIDRLSEVTGMSSEQIMSFIPVEAVTVKRLIKSVPNRATPVFNARRPLVCDVLVVDEVSMLDMALFYRLISALEPHCKLIMLGDKDQLSSVEAGAVLAELCACLRYEPDSRITSENLDFICEMTGYSPEQLLTGGLADHVALLQYSYRSREVPQIGELAALVNKPLDQEGKADREHFTGTLDDYLRIEDERRIMLELSEGEDGTEDAIQQRTDEVLQLIASDSRRAIDYRPLLTEKERRSMAAAAASAAGSTGYNGADIEAALSHDHAAQAFCIQFARDCVRPGSENNYAPFLELLQRRNFTVTSDPEDLEYIFNQMDRFRVLCSNHSGQFGDVRVNRYIEHEVKSTYLKDYALSPSDRFFPGQIVLITKNDNVLNLVNGYVGFCAFLKEESTDEASQAAAAAATADSRGRSRRLRLDETGRRLRVFIPMGIVEKDGRSVLDVNIISPMLLTSFESGYAMSIHKSQGSEYDRVCIMLSDRPNRVLTRELVYTAITRAKRSVQLLGPRGSLSSSLGRTVERASGLAQRLRG